MLERENIQNKVHLVKQCCYRMLFTISIFFIPMLNLCKADPIPCNGADPYDTDCPLDTWVIVLVVVAVIFAVTQLHRKQKSLQA